jgi:gas vesicle protein
MSDYVKLVESTLKRIKEEEEVIELSVEEQKLYFKGWAIGKSAEDKGYLSNNLEDILNDFKDDIAPIFGEEAISLEIGEVDTEIKTLQDAIKPSEEEIDQEVDPNAETDVEADAEADVEADIEADEDQPGPIEDEPSEEEPIE